MPGFKPGIKISLSAKKDDGAESKTKPKPTVAEVFNDDSESEEEMPAEARIRMRNIGKDTPTSAGPNSYGKTSRGFTDRRAELEKKLRLQLEEAAAEAEKRKLQAEESGDAAKRPRKAEDAAKISKINDVFTDTVQEDPDSS
ncbi:PEST proteolytic signal-containing nuclear protein [Galendromus occidentalis]|uniref:PEST proteolytic signal-containing nuclear protein n=1 Tax=Galendromus occidentalis TaxID=34638 RepID=A0AAJ6VXC2_9ACAR|nr:PEST proteolytic signal-containing nuclear protein [Galendromus occidentalis]